MLENLGIERAEEQKLRDALNYCCTRRIPLGHLQPAQARRSLTICPDAVARRICSSVFPVRSYAAVLQSLCTYYAIGAVTSQAGSHSES